MNGSERAIRVAIVDDQALFVSGMRMIIESDPGLEFVGSAANGLDAVELTRRVSCDVVLMDVRMPVMDGIEATRRITASGRDASPRVIILTTFYRSEAVFQAIRGGASGFLVKDSRPETVLDAIRTVFAGEEVLAAATTVDLVREFGAREAGTEVDPLESLTPREKETFLLVARGLSNSEVASLSYVSETTVKTHVRSVLAKLELRSRVQMTIFAYENGLLE